MTTPYISVLMPVYNAAPYLAEAIQSILAQTWVDFEFLIINDGSTDGSAAVIDGFARQDQRVKVLHQENRGIVEALNQGLSLARGRYIARMDADDISLPERFARQIAFLDANPSVAICGSACRKFYLGRAHGVIPVAINPAEISARLLFRASIVHPSVMMRRDAVVRGQFNYRAGYPHAEDFDLWQRMAESNRIANLPDVLVLWRVHGTQSTGNPPDVAGQSCDQIRLRGLQRLGILPTLDELAIHRSIAEGSCGMDFDYLEKVGQWLCKLRASNGRYCVYDVQAFARVLGQEWHKVCERAKTRGWSVWRQFASSPLGSLSLLTKRQRWTFAYCCLFKQPDSSVVCWVKRCLLKTRAGRFLRDKRKLWIGGTA